MLVLGAVQLHMCMCVCCALLKPLTVVSDEQTRATDPLSNTP